MEKYKILEHPADIRVQAFGKTKEELFLNALKGMVEVLGPKIKDKKQKIKNKISVKSMDLNALLVDFLSEVLYLTQINKRIYNDIKFFKFISPSNSSGRAELKGELFGNNVESFGEDIKAVTYHGLKIEKQNNQYQATILFDI